MPIHDSLVTALDDIAKRLLQELRTARDLLNGLGEVGVCELRASAEALPGVAAADSSRKLKSYSMALVYAIQAAAVRTPLGSSPLLVEGDAGYLVPSPQAGEAFADEAVERAVEFMSKSLEVQLLLRSSEAVEVALLDGSLFHFLWYSKFPEIPKNLRSFKEWPSRRREIWRSIVDGIVRMRRIGIVPLFVSKRVRRSYYAERLLSPVARERGLGVDNDLILLALLRASGRLPKGPFALEPVYIESVEDMPRPLNRLDPEDRSVIEPLVPATVTYVVFNPASQPYQVTVPGRLSPGELAELLSSLYPHSRSGYPDPLRLAHHACKIRTREFANILLKLGIGQLPTGRESLGEFA